MGMRIDKTKADKVQKPFQKEEKGWLDSAVDSVKEFFTPSEESYEDKVSKGLKDFKAIKSGDLPAPTPTPTPAPAPTMAPEVGAIDEHMQKVMAKRYFLQGLGLNWEPDEEDLKAPIKEEVVSLDKPEEDEDFIDLDEWEV